MKLRTFALVTLALLGCGSEPEPTLDGGVDASVDAKPIDATPDRSNDAPPDAPSDANDAGFDAGDVAVPCNGSTTGQCGPGFYCKATACGLGTCAPAPLETSAKNPICGCDGVTYWNETVAQNHGVSTQTNGECKPAKTCGGFANLKCPTGANCNFKQTSSAGCQISDPTGECWGLPAQCPQVVIGPQTRQCGQQKCTEACALIKSGAIWYDDLGCPQ
jgi:hypothetical protein